MFTVGFFSKIQSLVYIQLNYIQYKIKMEMIQTCPHVIIKITSYSPLYLFV